MKSIKPTLFGALLFGVFFTLINGFLFNELSGIDIGLNLMLGFGIGLLVFGLIPWIYQRRK